MPDRNAILQRLIEIIQSSTEIDVNKVSEDIAIREGLGLDSVDLVDVVMRIEEAYRIRLTYQELEKVGLVRELIDLIASKLASTQS